MASADVNQAVTLEVKGKVAIITLDVEKKLNALTLEMYYRLACLMQEVAKMDNVYFTVLTGKGRYFSAGADVGVGRSLPSGSSPSQVRQHWLQTFVINNLNITRAFYQHPKILITALNGPAVGLSAALTGFSDFVYCTPQAFLFVPFSSLGLVAEGGASRTFVTKLGQGKAHEALLMSKRITAQELLQTGYVNKIFEVDVVKDGSDKFLAAVLDEVKEYLGEDRVNLDSCLKIKALLRKPEREVLDRQNVEEVFGGLERFVDGIPQEEFKKIAAGQRKHKL